MRNWKKKVCSVARNTQMGCELEDPRRAVENSWEEMNCKIYTGGRCQKKKSIAKGKERKKEQTKQEK